MKVIKKIDVFQFLGQEPNVFFLYNIKPASTLNFVGVLS